MAIPKIIHQTFPERARLPAELEANIARLKELNPGWEHRFYDDAAARDFIARQYGADMVRCFDRLNPVYGPARADFFRYLAMYQHGGVYLDIKSTVLRPLEEILRPADAYLLSHWRNAPGERYYGWGQHPELPLPRGEYQQWHIVAAPQHAFLRAAILKAIWNIEHYDPRTFGVGKDAVLRVTGPIAYTLAIRPLLEQHPHRLVDIVAEGFQYSVFESSEAATVDEKLAHERIFYGHYRKMYDAQPVVLK